jgi:hypothetical protein
LGKGEGFEEQEVANVGKAGGECGGKEETDERRKEKWGRKRRRAERRSRSELKGER